MNDKIQRALDELRKLQSPEEALVAIEAIEKKRQEKYYIRYLKLIEGQLDAAKAFTPDKKIQIVLGGNRSGKSLYGAANAVACALGKNFFRDEPAWEWVQHLPYHEPPNNIWVVGLDFNVLRDVIWREKLLQGLRHPRLVPDDEGILKRVSEADWQIFFSNGSTITGKSADSGRTKFQSASVDLVWIDEEPEEEIFDECYQRTLDCGGKILVTLTPLVDISSGVRTPWVYDLVEDFKQGQLDIVVPPPLSLLDNPFVPSGEKEKAKVKWSGHSEEKARLFGGFIQRSGLVYPMWNPRLHMIPVTKLPKQWPSWVSIDPAPTGITAALWAKISPNDDIYLTQEYYEPNKPVSEHAKNIIVRNGGQPIDYWIIDPYAGSQKQYESHRTVQQIYRDCGIPARLAPRAEDFGRETSREYLLANTQAGSRHGKVFIFGALKNFKDEIEHYSWAFFQKGDQKGQSKDKPQKGRDHLLNAFQYLASMKPRGRKFAQPSEEEARRDVKYVY